jgi:hypothetical protein
LKQALCPHNTPFLLSLYHGQHMEALWLANPVNRTRCKETNVRHLIIRELKQEGNCFFSLLPNWKY